MKVDFDRVILMIFMVFMLVALTIVVIVAAWEFMVYFPRLEDECRSRGLRPISPDGRFIMCVDPITHQLSDP